MTHPSPFPVEDEFAAALRAAISARGLSLDRVRYHLAQHGHELSVATLSYWQSGRSRPERATSLAALGELELILNVEPGALSGKLPARRRTPRGGEDGFPSRSVQPLTDEASLLDETTAGIGLSADTGLQRIAVHDRLEVGPDRRGVTHAVRELFVAERDGVDRYPVVYKNPGGVEPLYVVPIRNCRVGQTIEVPDGSLVVAEMLLDRTLHEGESILVEHEVDMSSLLVDYPFIERAFVRPVRSAHTEVVFDPGALPLSAERYTVIDGVRRAEPFVIAGPSLHALVLDFGPGLYGLRWSW